MLFLRREEAACPRFFFFEMRHFKWISLPRPIFLILCVIICQLVGGNKVPFCRSPMLPKIFISSCQGNANTRRPITNPMRRKRGELDNTKSLTHVNSTILLSILRDLETAKGSRRIKRGGFQRV
ncbi:uncharacterized protein [Apostichopus japonicus]|uniref:uncharacterized protein isoform X2 n=1 Tax=Stichopus japonicus TaxID=307972 RepID=UPI003AB3F6BF